MLRKASDGAAWPCAAPLRGHTIVVQAHWRHRRGTSVKWHERKVARASRRRRSDAAMAKRLNLDQSGIGISPSKPAGPFPLKYRCRPGQGSREADVNGAERVHGKAARRFELLLLLPMLLSPSGVSKSTMCELEVLLMPPRSASGPDRSVGLRRLAVFPTKRACPTRYSSLLFCQSYSVTLWCVRNDSVRTDGLSMLHRGCGPQAVPVWVFVVP
jgi:hypothetical protein